MNVNVVKVKKALKKQHYKITNESDEINLELIKALEKFQKDNGLAGDGIFGYWTYDKIRVYFDEN
jgi:murein L,D-transpeptidase YcbB/YkuD